MPHKNPHCKNPECHRAKMVHSKWLEKARKTSIWDINNVWKREVKCPECGRTAIDWRTRVD